ncbi:MAG: hypothetical protein J7480_02870 [Microbacteriaceae bacterium]|nr:hypothetical protein [Microbacteriaceae bacterium]
MTVLDGNALAGELADVLGRDLTATDGRCAGCGHVAALADTILLASAMGRVLRCRGCLGVLVVVVTGADGISRLATIAVREWTGLPPGQAAPR